MIQPIYDEASDITLRELAGNALALVERARRQLSIAASVAVVMAPNRIYFYDDRAALDLDANREGGAEWLAASVVVAFDQALNFTLVE